MAEDKNINSKPQVFRYSRDCTKNFILLIVVGIWSFIIINPAILGVKPQPIGQVLPLFLIAVFIDTGLLYLFLQNLFLEIKVSPEGITLCKSGKQKEFYWDQISKLEIQEVICYRSADYDNFYIRTMTGELFFAFHSYIDNLKILLSIFEIHGLQAYPFGDIQVANYDYKFQNIGMAYEELLKKPFWEWQKQQLLNQKISRTNVVIFFLIMTLFFGFCGWIIFKILNP